MSAELFYANRVLQTSTTTGSGSTITLGAAVTGYRAMPSTADGHAFEYVMWAVTAAGAPTGDWEEGIGTYTHSGTTFTRVFRDSSTGSQITWAAGTKRVAIGDPVEGKLRIATLVLTDAQIKALPTTPIQIVTAAPSGYRWKPLGGTAYADTSAGAYTNINTTYSALAVESVGGNWSLEVSVNDNGTNPVLVGLTNLLGGTTQRVIDLVPGLLEAHGDWATPASVAWVLSTDVNTYTGLVAKALEVYIDNNSSGDLTGGNAANTLRITIYYLLEQLT